MKLVEIRVKPRINKCNGQINFAVPKKQVTKRFLDKIDSNKAVKFLFEED